MASAIQAGNLRLYAVSPIGQKVLAYSARNGGTISAGGSPDGVLANLTADKWDYIPKFNVVLSGGWKVFLTLEMDAADGCDASDSVIEIPLTLSDGSVKRINATDLGYTVDYPAATAAAVELPLGAGYTIPNGVFCKIGSNLMKGVISIQNDA